MSWKEWPIAKSQASLPCWKCSWHSSGEKRQGAWKGRRGPWCQSLGKPQRAPGQGVFIFECSTKATFDLLTALANAGFCCLNFRSASSFLPFLRRRPWPTAWSALTAAGLSHGPQQTNAEGQTWRPAEPRAQPVTWGGRETGQGSSGRDTDGKA